MQMVSKGFHTDSFLKAVVKQIYQMGSVCKTTDLSKVIWASWQSLVQIFLYNKDEEQKSSETTNKKKRRRLLNNIFDILKLHNISM